jgi:hypothetical protein
MKMIQLKFRYINLIIYTIETCRIYSLNEEHSTYTANNKWRLCSEQFS